MFRRKPAAGSIRGGYRFADKNMRHSMIREHVTWVQCCPAESRPRWRSAAVRGFYSAVICIGMSDGESDSAMGSSASPRVELECMAGL